MREEEKTYKYKGSGVFYFLEYSIFFFAKYRNNTQQTRRGFIIGTANMYKIYFTIDLDQSESILHWLICAQRHN